MHWTDVIFPNNIPLKSKWWQLMEDLIFNHLFSTWSYLKWPRQSAVCIGSRFQLWGTGILQKLFRWPYKSWDWEEKLSSPQFWILLQSTVLRDNTPDWQMQAVKQTGRQADRQMCSGSSSWLWYGEQGSGVWNNDGRKNPIWFKWFLEQPFLLETEIL